MFVIFLYSVVSPSGGEMWNYEVLLDCWRMNVYGTTVNDALLQTMQSANVGPRIN